MQPVASERPPVLELSSLPRRHPNGDAFLTMFGAQAVLRLGLDPVRAPDELQRREVTIDRLSPPTPGTSSVIRREIGWIGANDLPLYLEEYLVRVRYTANDNDLTEKAAIAVMALLIHELEGVTLGPVLQIGSSGDYTAMIGSSGIDVQVEVSGLREEPVAGRARTRLNEKLAQVLTKSPRGFASVTTFRWVGGQTAHSYLHYAEASSSMRAGGRAKKGRKK